MNDHASMIQCISMHFVEIFLVVPDSLPFVLLHGLALVFIFGVVVSSMSIPHGA